MLTFGDRIGIPGTELQLRVGVLILGVWWGVFTLPAVFILRDRAQAKRERESLGRAIGGALRDVRTTLGRVRQYRMLVLFLIGFLFFNDGIQTVIGQSSVFGKSEIGFEPSELLLLILVFQFVCLLGTLPIGLITDWLGQKRALMTYLSVWVLLLAAAYFVHKKWEFWCLSIVMGLVMGGTQSIARAIMGLMTPKSRTAEFFGFFNFSGKATSWMGNFLFGAVTLWTGSARLAIVSLLVFFIIGWALIAKIDIAQGRREAAGDEPGLAS